MRPNRFQITLTLVLLVVGLIFGIIVITPSGEGPSGGRQTNLIDAVEELTDERQTLVERLSGLRDEVADVEKDAASDQGVLAAFTEEDNLIKARAGLLSVRGPGLEIVLDDAPVIPPEENPQDYVIHDYDLMVVVNALWSGGAEALSINDLRVVSQTAVRSVGSTILINSQLTAAPYRVQAIGDPQLMAIALQEDRATSGLIEDAVDRLGLVVDVSESDDMVLPGYTGSLNFSHALLVR